MEALTKYSDNVVRGIRKEETCTVLLNLNVFSLLKVKFTNRYRGPYILEDANYDRGQLSVDFLCISIAELKVPVFYLVIVDSKFLEQPEVVVSPIHKCKRLIGLQ